MRIISETARSFLCSLDLNFWIAILSLTVATFTLVINHRTLKSQKETEANTARMSPDKQLGILTDIIRHLYCNLATVIAIQYKLERKGYMVYPSEQHLMKFMVPPDSIPFEQFYKSEEDDKKDGNKYVDLYSQLYSLSLRLRNYNMEVEAAMRHLPDPSISVDIKRTDIERIVNRTVQQIIHLCKVEEGFQNLFRLEHKRFMGKVRTKIVMRHFKYWESAKSGGRDEIPEIRRIIKQSESVTKLADKLYGDRSVAFVVMLIVDASIIANDRTPGNMMIETIPIVF